MKVLKGDNGQERVVTPRMERQQQVDFAIVGMLRKIELIERYTAGIVGALFANGIVTREQMQKALEDEGLQVNLGGESGGDSAP